MMRILADQDADPQHWYITRTWYLITSWLSSGCCRPCRSGWRRRRRGRRRAGGPGWTAPAGPPAGGTALYVQYTLYANVISVLDRHHVDADVDPIFNFDADPDPNFSYFSYLKSVLRIPDIVVWIRIRGSMPLTNGSGSCYFRHWSSRCQQKTNLKKSFSAHYFLEVNLHYFQRKK